MRNPAGYSAPPPALAAPAPAPAQQPQQAPPPQAQAQQQQQGAQQGTQQGAQQSPMHQVGDSWQVCMLAAVCLQAQLVHVMAAFVKG